MGSAIFLKEPNAKAGDGRFRNHTLEELVDVFNREVGCRGWVSSRATHLFNLACEFRHRQLGVDVVLINNSLSLGRKVQMTTDRSEIEFIPSDD